MDSKADISRDEFVEDLLANNLTTYFAATHPKYSKGNPAFRFTASPVSPAVPFSWRYADAKARLVTLSNLLSAEEAERRNINFVNPTLKDFMPAATLPTLRGGIQLLLPNERAYSHRHSANAFRLVLEAPESGAYTNVEGYRLPMCKGDLVLTPNWTWHDHNNEGDSNAIWYDGLDVLMAYFIGGVFFEEMSDVTGAQYQAVSRNASMITSSFDRGLVHRQKLFPEHIPASNNSLLYYPYQTARKTLLDLASSRNGQSGNATVLEYVNPLTGGPTFPTMSTAIQLVKEHSAIDTVRRTENIVFVTVEGSATFDIDDNRSFSTEAYDVTAIPSWVPYSIRNDADRPAILFSQSDRPVFQALGFYREQSAGDGLTTSE